MSDAGVQGPPDRIAVGKVTGAHGVHGEVSILVLTEVSERFDPGVVLALEDGRRLTVDTVRPHRSHLLVKF